MMNITDLFSTPEQGKRLAELVPDLKYKMAWTVVWEDWEYKHTDVTRYTDSMRERKMQHSPALTLQELRDVVKKAAYGKFEREGVLLLDSFDHHELENLLDVATAPELAAWVIERLEATP